MAMPEIDFHFNVSDKLAYGCRLLRKASASGAQVAVIAEPQVLAELDALLWTFSSTDFVAHCRTGAAPATLAATPVVLVETVDHCRHQDVLVNLGRAVPEGFASFKRFIEVVAVLPEDARAGRQRWKNYAAQGYHLVRFDQAGSGA